MKQIVNLLLLVFPLTMMAQVTTLPVQWNTDELYRCPKSEPFPSMDRDNVKAVLIDGPEYKGEPTQFFAYYALPEGADAQHPVPAMVLVHGGGGSAFSVWVQEWVSRGFAAISLDTTGKLPIRLEGDPFGWKYGNWALLPKGIHLDWGGFGRGLRPTEEQWPYCAVSEVILAHSFLRSIEGVDTTRVGITGNSWGGYLTMLTAAVDNRFKLAAPLYACGFYNQMNTLGIKPSDAFTQWYKLWDPQFYVPHIQVPLMWYGGATDFCFDFGCVQETLALCPEATLYRVARPQVTHTDGCDALGRPAEVYAFAERLLKEGKTNYPRVSIERVKGKKAELRIQDNGCSIDRVELYYTSEEDTPWANRKWEFQETKCTKAKEKMWIPVPQEARYCFCNVFTDDGLASSTPMIEVNTSQPGK